MRKLLYKKGRKVIPTLIEYTGKHENATPEMQLFVYNSDELSEFEDIKLSQLDKHLDYTKNNWINFIIRIKLFSGVIIFCKCD